jgi:hypothetical protein
MSRLIDLRNGGGGLVSSTYIHVSEVLQATAARLTPSLLYLRTTHHCPWGMQSNDIGAKDNLAICLVACYDSTCACTTEQDKKPTSFEMTSTSIIFPSKKAQMPNGLELDYFFALDSTRNVPDSSMSSGIRGHASPSRKNTSSHHPIDERISEPLTTAQPKSPSTHTAWHSEKMYVNNHGTHAFVGCRYISTYLLAISRLSTDVGGSKVGHAAWRNVGSRHVAFALPYVLPLVL